MAFCGGSAACGQPVDFVWARIGGGAGAGIGMEVEMLEWLKAGGQASRVLRDLAGFGQTPDWTAPGDWVLLAPLVRKGRKEDAAVAEW